MDNLTHTSKQELENAVGGRQKHYSYWYYAKCTACSEMLTMKSHHSNIARDCIKGHKNNPNSEHKDHLDKLIIVEEHC